MGKINFMIVYTNRRFARKTGFDEFGFSLKYVSIFYPIRDTLYRIAEKTILMVAEIMIKRNYPATLILQSSKKENYISRLLRCSH